MGKRMASLFHSEWAVPVAAGLGTLVLSLVVNLALVITGEWWWLLFCVGLPLVGVLMMVGLGGVIASKFGANVYTPNRPVVAAVSAAGSSPMQPSTGPGNYPPPPAPANPPLSEFIQPPDSGLAPAAPAPGGDQPVPPAPPPLDLRKPTL
jgi:hypothetical protein